MKPVKWAEAALLVIGCAIILWLAIGAWFDPLRFQAFAGDDLGAFGTDPISPFSSIGSSALSEKFRPVAASISIVISNWVNHDFHEMALFSWAIHAANGILFFLLLYRTIKLPLSLSVGVTVIVVFNRFATYLSMQDQAIMEGICITGFLLVLISSSSFLERPTIRGALFLTLLFGLIIYTHERYLVLAVPMGLLSAGTFSLNRRASIVLVSGVTAAGLSYLCIKKLLLQAPILVGTGGQSLAFDLPQISSFIWRGALNLVGINRGPAYLSLEDFPDSPWWIQFVSVASAVLCCGLIIGFARATILLPPGKERRASLLRLGFYVLTTAVLVIAASVTYRQEYRWLYPGYFAVLSLLSLCTVQLSGDGKRWARPIFACLLLLSLCRELHLARYQSRFYSFQAHQVASNLLATLREATAGVQPDAILIEGDIPSKDWIFLDGTFSRFYRIPRLEFGAKDSAIEQTDQSRLVLTYDASDRNFEIANPKPLIADESHRMDYSLLEHSPEALTPNERWATPTKTPVFVMAKNGVNCMAVVAPVDLDLPVRQGASVLHVCFSHLYAIGDGADLEITATGLAGTRILLSRVVPPLVNDDFPVWRKYEFVLPADTQQIELHVFSKTDPVADWIAVRDFSFD